MMTNRVAILIASQSDDVARGAASMVRELFDQQVPCSYCHYDERYGGSLNTRRMLGAIRRTVTDAGLVVCVDFGCVEALVEGAIETLPDALREQIRISDAPIVEGAIVAATIAVRGATLEEVHLATDALCNKTLCTPALAQGDGLDRHREPDQVSWPAGVMQQTRQLHYGPDADPTSEAAQA